MPLSLPEAPARSMWAQASFKNKDKTADVNVKVGIEPHEMPNGKKYINLKVLSYEK